MPCNPPFKNHLYSGSSLCRRCFHLNPHASLRSLDRDEIEKIDKKILKNKINKVDLERMIEKRKRLYRDES